MVFYGIIDGAFFPLPEPLLFLYKELFDQGSPEHHDLCIDERAYWYSQFGLAAHQIAKELCSKYGIKHKTYNLGLIKTP